MDGAPRSTSLVLMHSILYDTLRSRVIGTAIDPKIQDASCRRQEARTLIAAAHARGLLS